MAAARVGGQIVGPTNVVYNSWRPSHGVDSTVYGSGADSRALLMSLWRLQHRALTFLEHCMQLSVVTTQHCTCCSVFVQVISSIDGSGGRWIFRRTSSVENQLEHAQNLLSSDLRSHPCVTSISQRTSNNQSFPQIRKWNPKIWAQKCVFSDTLC